jgi:RNA polymerase sigma-70 factor (ECF subfamily)
VDERELTARARLGDESAGRALYDAHVDRVYWLAYRLSGRHDLAQDFTQDVFIRAFSRLDDYRGEAAFGSWLHTIAMSVVLNGLRKVKRFDAREAVLDEAAMVASPIRHAEPDLKDRLTRAIDDLPEGCRVVFLMHDVEGFTHEEIGTALGITAGTSKAQLSRAKAKLRVSLADFAGDWIQ